MTWIVFPRSSVEVLINSKRLRAAASSHFSNVTSSGAAVVSAGDGNVASLVPFGDGSIVVAAWAASNTADMMIAGQPLLTIWSEPRQSTFLSIPDEELPNVLERICNLAIRLWEGVSVSELWNPNKVANHHSIFVSNRIMDLRLAYEMRKLDDISHLNVGTVYYAYRQEKSIQVPPLTESDVASILRTVARPDLVGDETFEDAKGSKRNEDDDPDVLINRGRGEDRHLFSMSRSDWMDKDSPLTRQQRRIIREKKFPLRIHGPVGSGKTLVLILKALELLRIGLENKEKCKVLIILHNNEVRNNVRAAIEAIDESGFLATTKNDSQFLDVETLHGWCMRELKIDTGGLDYALHSDPIASKAKQDEILAKVLEKAIGERLLKNRSLLSSDLLSHFDGSRDRLISNMRHEIAIRIKGRGLRDELQLYVETPLKSFVGRGENRHDRYFIFKIAEEYERELQKAGRLDTDDVILSMQSRLSAPLWNRQRKVAGYDFVLVDETHLFNENERRVLPYLTRGDKESVPIVMTFDEAQSIGGRRVAELEQIGIHNSE